MFVPGVTVRERRSGDIGTLLQIGPSADHPHAGPENLIVRVEQSRLSLGYFVYDLHWTHFDPLEGAAEPEGASAKPGEESERQG